MGYSIDNYKSTVLPHTIAWAFISFPAFLIRPVNEYGLYETRRLFQIGLTDAWHLIEFGWW